MSSERKFVVKKDAKTDVITYMEYEKLKGFNVNLRIILILKIW